MPHEATTVKLQSTIIHPLILHTVTPSLYGAKPCFNFGGHLNTWHLNEVSSANETANTALFTPLNIPQDHNAF